MVKQTQEVFGKVDILINNASIAIDTILLYYISSGMKSLFAKNFHLVLTFLLFYRVPLKGTFS